MREETTSRKPTRREFLNRCVLGVGCVVLAAHRSGMRDEIIAEGAKSGQDTPARWSKEAMFCRSTSTGVQCLKCPNFCELKENQAGKCRNRVNRRGKLYSIAYGNPCAVHVDPIEKKPFFHFLPTTRAFSIAAAGCNLRCLNCQNWQISQFSPEETENFELMPDRVVEESKKSACASIAYTYSEPTTFYEYALDTARLAKKEGVRNVLKSNGYINEEPLRLLCKVLDAANIDLKSFNDDTYWRLSEARLEPVLTTLKVLREEGVWLEITNLVVPSWTDNLDEIKRMCEWLCKNGLADAPLHFTRFVPLYKLTHLPTTPVSILEQAREVALKSGVQYVYVGNVPGHAAENTYCHACSALILERRGFAILKNYMRQGTCSKCHAKIPGVWT